MRQKISFSVGMPWQVYKDGEAVRASVALAIVKLLKRLPTAALRAALPTSLQKVANLLRTRLQRIRQGAWPCPSPNVQGASYQMAAAGSSPGCEPAAAI